MRRLIDYAFDEGTGSAERSLDSLTASRMSFVVALVSIPGTSKGDFRFLREMFEKAGEKASIFLMAARSYIFSPQLPHSQKRNDGTV